MAASGLLALYLVQYDVVGVWLGNNLLIWSVAALVITYHWDTLVMAYYEWREKKDER